MSKIPKLRFKEFSGEWEEKILEEIGDFKNGLNKSKEDFGFGYPFVNLMDVFGKSTLNCINFGMVNATQKDLQLYDLKKGDVLFIRSSVKREGVGETVLLLDNFINTTYSGFLIRFRERVNILDILFKKYCFKTSRFRNELLAVSTTSANTNINQDSLNGLYIRFPSKLEQQKIASFFSAVDLKIDLLIRKKELLEQYKKGVMQKIFSQELRFKADGGSEFPEWEEKDLKSIIDNFIVPMRDKPKDLSGLIPWCRIEDFDGKYLFNSKSNQGVSTQIVNEMNLKIYPIDTLLVSCSADLGRCAIVKKELITNQTFIGLVPKHEQVNVEFLFYSMTRLSKVLNSLSSGTTISYLSRKEFEKFEINLPCRKEQTKIANFLSVIDSKIDLLAGQLREAKNFKKGLLQQMFV